ncbi:class F sortase [Actinomycetospora atypica]|uniref:Class F sortase n=1 Tax=Actinomycetospora atypica TaxID=1290095 RepID=A0ABV9YIP4_9PSEU
MLTLGSILAATTDPTGVVAPSAAPPAAVPAARAGPVPVADTATGTVPGAVVPAEAAAPVRLRAPAIGLDAPVVAVGVDPDGRMEVPARIAEVGWYRFGPAPGDPAGSAVLAGHVDDRVQGEGAFATLGRLDPGDEVLVDGPRGTVVHRVTDVRRWSKQDVPLDELFARTGPGRLTLITCDGPFDRDQRSYRDNLVVTATPIG